MTQPEAVPTVPIPRPPVNFPASLDREVLDRLEIETTEIEDLPGRIYKLDWGKNSVWVTDRAVPGDESLIIHAMFASPFVDDEDHESERPNFVAYVLGDVRVYCRPTADTPGQNYRRFTINRASPAQISEAFSKDAFLNEVTREIAELLALDSEDVGAECEACGTENRPENLYCSNCGAKLPDEEETPDPAPEQAEAVGSTA